MLDSFFGSYALQRRQVGPPMFHSSPRFAWLVPLVILGAMSPHRLSAGSSAAAAAPTVVYATLLGGAAGNFDGIQDLAVDAQGYAYVTGQTESSDFPIKNALDPAPPLRNQSKAFVAKFAPDGALVFSTFLGSRDTNSNGSTIAVDQTGAIYVAGSTGDGFPIKNAFQSTIGGLQDAFIAKLSADGASIIFASYLGGNQAETVRDLKIDGQHNIYLAGIVSGSSAPGPVTFPAVSPIQTSYGGGESDGFFAILSADGQQILKSSLFDIGLVSTPPTKAGEERVTSLQVREGGDVWISGRVVTDANTDNVAIDGYWLRILPTNTPSLTRLDTFADFTLMMMKEEAKKHEEQRKAEMKREAKLIDAALADKDVSELLKHPPPAPLGVAPTATTESPIVSAVLGACLKVGTTDCRHSGMLATGDAASLLSELVNIPASDEYFVARMAVDARGNVYIVGDTSSTRLATTNPTQAQLGGLDDAVVAAYGPTGATTLFVTYLGGDGSETPTSIAVDAQGNIYVAGVVTVGTTFPSTPGAFQRDIKGRNDGFLVKISPVFP